MSRILLIAGSVFGAAHALADEITTALEERNHSVKRPENPQAEDLAAGDFDWLLVVTSTTGVGELPDELVPLYNTCLLYTSDAADE